MVLRMRLALTFALVLAASTCFGAGPRKPANRDAGVQPPKQAAEKDSDKQTAEARVAAIRKKVEGRFRVKGRGDYFVVALLTTSFHKNVKRTVPEALVKDGRVVAYGTKTEFRVDGKFYPIQTAEFRAIKGRDAAIQFVVDELAKPTGEGEVQTRFGKKTTGPPPTRDWNVIGRFVDAASADNTAGAAKRAFEAEPQWEVTREGEFGR